MKDKKDSTNYPMRINNVLRYKSKVVAQHNGRTLAEHIKWLLNTSITNYEINNGQIDLTKEFGDAVTK